MRKKNVFTLIKWILVVTIFALVAVMFITDITIALIKGKMNIGTEVTKDDIDYLEIVSQGHWVKILSGDNQVSSILNPEQIPEKNIKMTVYSLDKEKLEIVKWIFYFKDESGWEISKDDAGPTLQIIRGWVQSGVLIENAKPIHYNYLVVEKPPKASS